MEMKAEVEIETNILKCMYKCELCPLMLSSVAHCFSAYLNLEIAQFLLRPVAHYVVKLSSAKLAFPSAFCDLC